MEKEENAMAKVIIINGSPRDDQCIGTALAEMLPVFREEGIETEVINIGKKDIKSFLKTWQQEQYVII